MVKHLIYHKFASRKTSCRNPGHLKFVWHKPRRPVFERTPIAAYPSFQTRPALAAADRAAALQQALTQRNGTSARDTDWQEATCH